MFGFYGIFLVGWLKMFGTFRTFGNYSIFWGCWFKMFGFDKIRLEFKILAAANANH